MIKELRLYNITCLQLGIYHTDEKIMTLINQKCTLENIKEKIHMLKDCSFNIEINLIPFIPFSSPEKDKLMFDKFLEDKDLQVDQIKIYPIENISLTNSGDYQYGEENIVDVLKYVENKINPWMSLNNKICDTHKVKKNFEKNLEKKIREYPSSNGKEFFISYESSERNKIYGYTRLRLSKNAGIDIFPELHHCAIIRELCTYHEEKFELHQQLLEDAEKIAFDNGFKKIGVYHMYR